MRLWLQGEEVPIGFGEVSGCRNVERCTSNVHLLSLCLPFL